MSAVPLARDVWRIPTGKGDRDNAFLVRDDDGLTLVDVGWARSPDRIISALADIDHDLGDIRRIVITHAHPDHVRGLASFRSQATPRADVLIHRDDADWLRTGRVPVGGRAASAARFLDAMPLLHWTPVEPDGHLSDGDELGGLRIIHTPGHSPGHAVLFHQPTGTLLAGDVLLNRGATPGNGPDALAWDPALRDASAARLPHDVNAIGVAHGAPLVDANGIDAYLTWLARYAQNGDDE